MRCTMVEPTWLLMSSPTIGTPASRNLRAHSGSEAMKIGMAWGMGARESRDPWAYCARSVGVRGDEDRDGVDEGDVRIEARLGVVALGLLGTDREVGHHPVGLGV